jgi:hypothetical protein
MATAVIAGVLAFGACGCAGAYVGGDVGKRRQAVTAHHSDLSVAFQGLWLGRAAAPRPSLRHA